MDSLREKFRAIAQATYTHSRNLACFVFTYKGLQALQQHLQGKQLQSHSFLAACVGGWQTQILRWRGCRWSPVRSCPWSGTSVQCWDPLPPVSAGDRKPAGGAGTGRHPAESAHTAQRPAPPPLQWAPAAPSPALNPVCLSRLVAWGRCCCSNQSSNSVCLSAPRRWGSRRAGPEEPAPLSGCRTAQASPVHQWLRRRQNTPRWSRTYTHPSHTVVRCRYRTELQREPKSYITCIY